jgi:peptidoglycan/xylan/chitin deacetylase (PgdA/CDA1 family)
MSAAGRWLEQALGTLMGRRPPFVLCYHGVGRVSSGADPHGLFVSKDLFGEHIEIIRAQQYELLAVGDLWRSMQAGADTERKASISFDDGLVQTAREAIPLLLERGIGCSVYIATGLMGMRHPDLDDEMIVSREEVLELAQAGVEIGAHTVDHVELNDLPFEQALDQLRRSRATLEDLLGKEVTSMAYPYGKPKGQTPLAAERAGYEIACACVGAGPWQPFSLPREPIFPSATPLRLRAKMAGLYGPLHAAKAGQLARVWKRDRAGVR